MSLANSPTFLRNVLWADALSCLACGLLQVISTATASERLGLPAALLADSGVFLLLCGAAVAFLAARNRTPGTLIRLLIAGNAAWAVACIALLLVGRLELTLLGKTYVVAQILAVTLLAELQYLGVRQTRISSGHAAAAPGDN
ncbi:MAG: hypothetical protein ACLPV8_05415 [Steroidobacteraceae bacterium]